MNRATKRERLRRVRMWSRLLAKALRWLSEATLACYPSQRWIKVCLRKRRKAWRYGENFVDWPYATWWSRAPKRFLEAKR